MIKSSDFSTCPSICYFFFFKKIIISILMSVRWYLIIISICIFWWCVMLSIFPYMCCLFDYFLWRNAYSSPIFKCFFFFLSCRSSLYILVINLLSIAWFTHIFFHFMSYLFTLLIVFFFYKQDLLILIKSSLSLFFTSCLSFWCHIKKSAKSLPNIIRFYCYFFLRVL